MQHKKKHNTWVLSAISFAISSVASSFTAVSTAALFTPGGAVSTSPTLCAFAALCPQFSSRKQHIHTHTRTSMHAHIQTHKPTYTYTYTHAHAITQPQERSQTRKAVATAFMQMRAIPCSQPRALQSSLCMLLLSVWLRPQESEHACGRACEQTDRQTDEQRDREAAVTTACVRI